MRIRVALLKFYMQRIWFVLTKDQKSIYVLRAYEVRGDELIKLAEKASGLCIRDF
jgi:hypothetical protein